MADPVAFRAMGSPCRIVADGGPPELPRRAVDLVEQLDARWSRFRPDSEVSAVNRSSGSITVVTEETFRLISLAAAATDLTDGLFNPLMLDQLESHGYSEPWDDANPPRPSGDPVGPVTAEPIELYPEAGAVRLPAGTRFDPGGIGKGLAVDLAVELCIAGGATTISVELGGDLRVHGDPWYGPAWAIGVANPFDRSADVATFTPSSGAVTTSTTLRRCWSVEGETYNHLLDPRTGRPTTSDIVAVTTCAGEAWWAEVVAKSALLAGTTGAQQLLRSLQVPGIAVAEDGQVVIWDDPESPGPLETALVGAT